VAAVPSSVGVGEPAVITKRIDNTRVTTTEGAVERQVIGVADPEDPNARAKVVASAPDAAAYGIVTRNIPSGTQAVQPAIGSTAVVTRVAGSITTVTLLAANSARLGAMIYNDTPAGDLWIKFGATASFVSFTVRLFSGGFFIVPAGYTGRIDGIWNVADGAAQVTEVTA
jgi:hypothetical protein